MLLTAALLVIASFAVLLWGLQPWGQAAKISANLERLQGLDVRAFRQRELSEPAKKRLLDPLIERLAGAGRVLTPGGRLERLRVRVEQAGRPYNLDLNRLLALKFVSLLLGIVLLFLSTLVRVVPPAAFVLLAAAAVVLSYYLPDLVLRSWQRARQRRISRALPDFLDLLTVTVEAGLGLDASLGRIAERVKDPLKEELLITLHHMRIGQSREVALKELANRCQIEDLDKFVASLIQSQRLGVSLGQILRIQSEHMRTVRRQRIEERARKAPTKMLFPLVLCIFPTLFIVILGPALIKILEFAAQYM